MEKGDYWPLWNSLLFDRAKHAFCLDLLWNTLLGIIIIICYLHLQILCLLYKPLGMFTVVLKILTNTEELLEGR